MNVFISYRRRHGGIAIGYLLSKKLSSLNIDVFFDLVNQRDKTGDYQKELAANIEKSDYVLLLLQPGLFMDLDGEDFIKEILLAKELGKEIIAISIDPNFNWKNEFIPPELETQGLQKLEIKSLSVEKLDDDMITLINCFSKHQEMIPHYLFLHEAERNTLPGAFVPESAITNVPLSMRWCHAKRVSLMSLGGGSILGVYQRTVADLFEKGVEFRFITVDPKGKSRKDAEGKKMYSAYAGQDHGYLKQRQSQIVTMIRSMQERNSPTVRDNISYRVTGEHLTMTLQWVEGECDQDSYIFVSFLPTVGINQQQADCGSALITRNNKLYDFFAAQFELIWKDSKIII